MGRCKEIEIKVIPPPIANAFVRKHHYSGKVVPNSTLHFGAFLDGKLHGVLSYGNSMDKRKTMQLVEGTTWNGFLELNRMAFDDYLPRNSESYCIGKTLRMIRKQAPHVKWVISFADGTQCGDGTIYRASNFLLTGIRKNTNILQNAQGDRTCNITITAHMTGNEQKKALQEYKPMRGFQLRYVYFLDPKWRDRLKVPVLPFSVIDEMHAGMYKGQNVTQAERHAKKSAAQLEKETNEDAPDTSVMRT